MMDTNEIAYIIIAAVAVLWVLPSLLVGIRAGREGYGIGVGILLSLVMGWPVVLLLVTIFGERSPVCDSLRMRA